MRNIRKALKPGGELTMIVWRRREDNPWLHDAELRSEKWFRSSPTRTRTRCIADRDRFPWPARTWSVRCCAAQASIDIAFERFDADICVGKDLHEAVEFAMALGPAGEIIRLAGEEGVKRKDAGRRGAAGDVVPLCARRRRLGTVEHLVRHRAQPLSAETVKVTQ